MKSNITHNTISMEELFGNSREYKVPKFQRNYSWSEEHWGELWDDIVSAKKNKRNHYMGYIVVQETGNAAVRRVIDGQQRLTTLSILTLSVIALLDELIEKGQDTDNNKNRKEALMHLLVVKSAAKLTQKSRLVLGMGDDEFYRLNLMELNKPKVMGRLSPSNKKMWEALEYFKDKIRGYVKDNINGKNIVALLENTVGKKLFFTEMTVGKNDTNAAYIIFETLNARGVELSSADLLKNFLFAKIAEKRGGKEDFRALESYWNKIISQLGKQQPTTFFRYYWHSTIGKVVNKKNLFKTLKAYIKTPDEGYKFLKETSNIAVIYAELRSPTDDFCDNQKIIDMLNTLNLFGVSSLYPLLISAYRRWGVDNSYFERTLRNCVNLSFRRSVIVGQNPNDLEKAFTVAAAKVWNNKDATFSNDVLPTLQEVDISDGTFKDAFKKKIIRQEKLVRYVLFRLEAQMSARLYNRQASKYTIEHILPQNSDDEWVRFDNPDDYVWRLGNMTILGKKEQRTAGNENFAAKRDVYEKSEFSMTKKIAEYWEEWDEDAIGQRQSALADCAKGVWKLE